MGVNFFLKQPFSKSTLSNLTSLAEIGSSTTTAPLSSVSETATTEQLTTLSLGENDLGGYVFHDYNGNGILDESEPIVDDVEIVAQGYYATVRAQSQHGLYVFRNLPKGSYRIYPVHPQNKFRYMCRSNEEVVDTRVGYRVDFNGKQRLDMALMEGFLTLPFPKGVPIYVDPELGHYFYHGPGPNALWWNDQHAPYDRPSNLHTPEEANPSTDFFMPIGTELKAAAPAVVNDIKTESDGVQWISLTHNYGYGTTCLHIEKALVPIGAHVNRGDTIALSGRSGIKSPPDDIHTAFQLWREMPDGNYYCIDSYSPVAGVPKGAWIAGTWKWYPSNDDWISQGYWTKLNDPQYPPSF